MDSPANPDVDEDEADVAEIERELDKRVRMLEELMNRRREWAQMEIRNE